MTMYRVKYQSMSALYGPKFIEADSEYEAKRKFAGTSFSRDEMGLITAREVSSEEIAAALRESERERE